MQCYSMGPGAPGLTDGHLSPQRSWRHFLAPKDKTGSVVDDCWPVFCFVFPDWGFGGGCISEKEAVSNSAFAHGKAL